MPEPLHSPLAPPREKKLWNPFRPTCWTESLWKVTYEHNNWHVWTPERQFDELEQEREC